MGVSRAMCVCLAPGDLGLLMFIFDDRFEFQSQFYFNKHKSLIRLSHRVLKHLHSHMHMAYYAVVFQPPHRHTSVDHAASATADGDPKTSHHSLLFLFA